MAQISEYVTVAEAAQIIGVDRSQVIRYCNGSGQAVLPAIKLGKQWLIRRSDAKRFKRIPVGNPHLRNPE